MRWLANSPSETNAAYCDHCMADRREDTLCVECPAQEHLSILPENETAVRVFYRAWNQWHLNPRGMPFALRLDGVEVITRSLGIELDDELLENLQLMEATRVQVEHEKLEWQKQHGE